MMKIHQQQTVHLHKESINKIKEHKSTKKITYKDFPEAFDYINNRFAYTNINVKEAEVYVAKRSYLNKIGYKGIGGFYSRLEKIIVIPDSMPETVSIVNADGKDRWKSIRANLSPEEILVHELCHYVSGKTCSTDRSMQIEEEFAYGNMVDFCRNRGRSDEDIIRSIFMPYLVSVILKKKTAFFCQTDEQDRLLFESVIKEAEKLGYDIITIWDKKNKSSSDTGQSLIDNANNKLKLDFD